MFSVLQEIGIGCWIHLLDNSYCLEWFLDAIGRQRNDPVIDRKGWLTEVSIGFLEESAPIVQKIKYRNAVSLGSRDAHFSEKDGQRREYYKFHLHVESKNALRDPYDVQESRIPVDSLPP